MAKVHYQTFLLSNGLRVVVHPDPSVPKVVLSVIYRVGAKDEDENRTGFAHLFEHLMFGGSQNIEAYDTPLQRVGGENNAFTNNDITNYYISLPSSQVETAFWLESDRMLELDFNSKSLEVQRKVVIEEFKQKYLNKPYGDAHFLIREAHFQKHPYRWPTIGKDISHIEKATLEEVKDFFYGFYAPNNATLVVAGDISAEKALELAEKWFGPIPSRVLRKKPLPVEPPQVEARFLTVNRPVPFTGVYKMFHVPKRVDRGFYTTDILTDLLSSGRASILYNSLVKEKEIATSIRAYSWAMHDPGMVSMDAILAPGKSVEEYEEALAIVINDLSTVEEAELTRVKTSIETQFVLERTTLLNLALSLSVADVLGDPELINQFPEIYQSLSLEEVRAASKQYFSPANCTTLYYLSGKS